LAQRIGISDSTIKRELAVLKNKGYLNRDGGKTYGKWIVLKEI
jgi:DeoR/GlpR family transcriptional regulator of sugar metabolism